MPKIEVLAPVGNRAMLEAALAAGADAVYLGGKTGNARAFAGNFTDEEVKQAIQDCHLRGVKTYLTLNTLVKNHEMDAILDFADAAVQADIDAIILQDMGLFSILKQRYPTLSLHASTQMNVHSLAGILQAEKLGFERIIAGRETTLEELERMRDGSNVEVELFVHGSLCVSVSGQCLLSGLIGGRSGNRGRCAQPCRKVYQTKTGQPDTLLSLRDLNTLDHMETWKKLHIRSLKIEGRMKKPEYVFAVTKMVKAALNNEPIKTDLLDVSSRSFTKGFTLGDFGRAAAQTEASGRGTVIGTIRSGEYGKYIACTKACESGDTLQIVTERGKEIPLTITSQIPVGGRYALEAFPDAKTGTPVRRLYAKRIENALCKAQEEALQLPLQFSFQANEGEPAVLQAVSGHANVTVQSEAVVQKARKQPVTEEDIRSRLARTGETVFSTPVIYLHWGEDLFIPLGEINRIRREAVSQLQDKLATHHNRKRQSDKPARAFQTVGKPGLHIEIADNRLTDHLPMDAIDRVYTSDTEEILRYKEQWNCPVFLVLPETADEKAEVFAQKNAHAFDGILAKDLAGAEIARSVRLPVHFDASVHCMNDACADALLAMPGSTGITASVEMAGQEMAAAPFVKEAEVIVFGPVVAMKLRQCPFAVEKGCKNDSGCASCAFARSTLTDAHGAVYYVERKGRLSYLYFSDILNRIDRFADASIRPAAYRLHLGDDPSNAAWLNYAEKRLIERKPEEPPKRTDYWQMKEMSDIRWNRGVE